MKSAFQDAPTVVYLRESTDDQLESGAGIARDLDACTAWAVREGVEVLGTFQEAVGLSGGTPLDECPALNDALATLPKGGVFLVAKRDRLARDRIKIALFEAVLKGRRCRLISAAGEGTGGDDPNDPTSFLLKGVIDLFNEFERLTTGWRTRGAMLAKRRRLERTGNVPIGYRLEDDGRRATGRRAASRARGPLPDLPIALVADEEGQEALRLLLTMRSEGSTFRAIRDALNDSGHRTNAGKPFSASTVHYLFHYYSKHPRGENHAPSNGATTRNPQGSDDAGRPAP